MLDPFRSIRRTGFTQTERHPMTSLSTKIPLALITGLTLVGALSACATTDTSAPAEEPTTDAPVEDSTTDAGADAGAAAYVDGTYEASGQYQSPNGTETVEVTVTLASDIITAVEVVGLGESPTSKRYQGEFIDGIGEVVVGKDIDDISVSKVAGSSLTSGGFNAAIETIKADAAS
jgi:uncharacterized protein with FMN-binding domain